MWLLNVALSGNGGNSANSARVVVRFNFRSQVRKYVAMRALIEALRDHTSSRFTMFLVFWKRLQGKECEVLLFL